MAPHTVLKYGSTDLPWWDGEARACAQDSTRTPSLVLSESNHACKSACQELATSQSIPQLVLLLSMSEAVFSLVLEISCHTTPIAFCDAGVSLLPV